MRRVSAVLLGAAVLNGPAPAWAGEAGRYAFLPAASGVFRLDTRTGAVTLCVERDAALVCTPAQDKPGARKGALARDDVAPHERGETIRRVRRLAGMMMARVVTLVRALKGGEQAEAAL